MYAYKGNNPVKWVDPSGMFVIDWFTPTLFNMSEAYLRANGVEFSSRNNGSINTITMGGVTFNSDGSIVGGGNTGWNDIMSDYHRSQGYRMTANAGVIAVGGWGTTPTPVFQIGIVHTPVRDSFIMGGALGVGIIVGPPVFNAVTSSISSATTAITGGASALASRVLGRSGSSASTSHSNVENIARGINEWLGDGTRMIINSSGDRIFISADGTRKVRFDINNTSPHSSVHMHFEYLRGTGWRPVDPNSPQVYPRDVPRR